MVQTKDQLHALGVIAANFNRLENKLLGMFLIYLGFDDVMSFLFARLRDNSLRMDLLRRAVELKGETPEIIEAINYFCKAFGTCADNRNILMHGGVTALTDEKGVSLVFNKGKKENAIDWNHYLMDLTALRRVADETQSFCEYGARILNYIVTVHRKDLDHFFYPWRRGPAPLPDKPPLPTQLTPLSPLDPIAEMIRPRS
jgi:hypothetical protein